MNLSGIRKEGTITIILLYLPDYINILNQKKMNTHIKLKSFLATFFLLLSFGINAQTMLSEKEGNTKEDYKWRKNYINLGYVNTTMKQDGSLDLNSNFGATFSIGRTFFLHKRPIGGVLRFGIDATWFDINYTNYKIKNITNEDTKNNEYQQGEISMNVGPSITIKTVGKLTVHGYFRYAPSFSGLYNNDTFYGNYATFYVGGASISYCAIGLGVESRFGDCKYKEIGSSNEEVAINNKTKYNGWRAYLTFRF